LPFQTGPIVIERTAGGLKTLAQIEAAAKQAIQDKVPGGKRIEEDAILEDEAGNRLVRFRTTAGHWSYKVHTVAVKPDGTVAGVSERPVSTCVAAGTLLDGESGAVPIESVRPGDRLWGFDPARGQRVLTTIRVVRRGVAEETLVFGKTLRVTAVHPLYVNGSWQEAGQVGERDELLTADLRWVPAGTARRVRQAVEVFDLTVDEPHNFFAGRFLVHNKDRDYWPQVDDLYYRLWPLPEAKK
jgi:hypothetical protein